MRFRDYDNILPTIRFGISRSREIGTTEESVDVAARKFRGHPTTMTEVPS